MPEVKEFAPAPHEDCPFCGEPHTNLQCIKHGYDKSGNPEYLVTCGWCYSSASLSVWNGMHSRSPHATDK